MGSNKQCKKIAGYFSAMPMFKFHIVLVFYNSINHIFWIKCNKISEIMRLALVVLSILMEKHCVKSLRITAQMNVQY